MNLETYFTGTKKDMIEDIESKVNTTRNATNYQFKWYRNLFLEYVAAGAILYGGEKIGIPKEIITLSGCTILLDLFQRVLTMGIGVVKYHTRNNITSTEEKDPVKEKTERLKHITTTPSFVGWYRTAKQILGGK